MADSGLSLLLPVSLVHPEDTLAESAQLYINHMPYLKCTMGGHVDDVINEFPF